MNPKFKRLNEFFTTITDNNSHAHFDADPDAEVPLCRSRVLNLYCACVFGKNALTAARLSAKGLSIQKLLSLSIHALKAHSIRQKIGDGNAEAQARRPSSDSQGGTSAGADLAALDGGAGGSVGGSSEFNGSAAAVENEQDLMGFETESDEDPEEDMEVAIRTMQVSVVRAGLWML
jgi:hypothetical protein